MNGPDENGDFDRVSNALRAGDSELPPPNVDQAVLRQASDALKHERTKIQVWQRWLVSGALAATLVLSVSLTVQLMVPETTIMTSVVERQQAEQAIKPGRVDPAVNTPAATAARLNVEASAKEATATADGADPEALAKMRRESTDKDSLFETAQEEMLPGAASESKVAQASANNALRVVQAAPPIVGRTDQAVAGFTDSERSELRRLVEAQQEQDRQEFLASYLESDEYRQAVYGDPERWLAGIADLIEMGEIALARNELNEFLVAYPDYKLDEQFQL